MEVVSLQTMLFLGGRDKNKNGHEKQMVQKEKLNSRKLNGGTCKETLRMFLVAVLYGRNYTPVSGLLLSNYLIMKGTLNFVWSRDEYLGGGAGQGKRVGSPYADLCRVLRSGRKQGHRPEERRGRMGDRSSRDLGSNGGGDDFWFPRDRVSFL